MKEIHFPESVTSNHQNGVRTGASETADSKVSCQNEKSLFNPYQSPTPDGPGDYVEKTVCIPQSKLGFEIHT